MDTKNTNEEKEKIAYETYMEAEGYVKIDNKWKRIKYPEKDPKSYKEALPTKG